MQNVLLQHGNQSELLVSSSANWRRGCKSFCYSSGNSCPLCLREQAKAVVETTTAAHIKAAAAAKLLMKQHLLLPVQGCNCTNARFLQCCCYSEASFVCFQTVYFQEMRR